MAVTHPPAIRNAIADLVVDSIDAGAGAGTIQMQTSADGEVATLGFSDPAFSAASGGTANANAVTSDPGATGGTMAKFKCYDSDSNQVGFAGSVGASGEDINFAGGVVVGAGATVSLSSLTYTAPV